MGKLGVIGLSAAAFAVAALLPVREAAAQEFGQSWVDRITHAQEQERGPLQAKPFNWTADAGVRYGYDSNVFLAPSGSKKSDSIVIPFVQAGLTYTEPKFDVEAGLLANYNYYTKEDADDDEERLYFRARQTSSRWNFEISELFEHVSSPSGVVFLDRVSRFVSSTVPKMAFDIGRNWAFELGGQVQIVRFADQPYADGQDNTNFNVDVALVYRTAWGFDVLGQFGYYNINYIADQSVVNGTPDVFGYTYRLGFRGQIVERLSLEGLIGYGSVSTDYFASTGNDINESTFVANLRFRYEATDKVNFYLDFARQYAFLGFGDPFTELNVLTLLANVELTQEFSLRGRLQAERSDSALNVKRTYYGAGIGASYRFNAHWVVDGDVGFRGGKTENATGEVKFSDILGDIGLAFSW
jgi:hypothetical protein